VSSTVYGISAHGVKSQHIAKINIYKNQFIFFLFFLPYGTILRELKLYQVFHNNITDLVGLVRCKLGLLLWYYMIILRRAKKYERKVNLVSSVLICVPC
jgi:hypothetical protein